MTQGRVRIVSIFFWFEARGSHIPRAKSALAMVAKARAVQTSHFKQNAIGYLLYLYSAPTLTQIDPHDDFIVN